MGWSWDANGDGVVDYYEFLHHFMDTSSTDREDGKPTPFESLDALLLHCTVENGKEAVQSNFARQQKVQLIHMFREIDADGDGLISTGDLRAALSKNLPANTKVLIDDTIKGIFQERGANNDGLIDLYEFSSRYAQLSAS